MPKRQQERATRDLNKLLERLGVVKGIDDQARTVTGYASTGTVDRYGDVVQPDAFKNDLKRFLDERHLFAAGHRYVNERGEPTIIGKVIDAKIDKNGLLATFRFDSDPISELWWQKYKSGTLNAFSVGFIPVKWHDEENDGERIRYYDDVELLEISAVPIPANRESMVTNSADLAADHITELTKKIDDQGALIVKLEAELGKFRDEHLKAFRSLQNDVLEQVGVATGRGVPHPVSAIQHRTAPGDNQGVLKRFIASQQTQRE